MIEEKDGQGKRMETEYTTCDDGTKREGRKDRGRIMQYYNMTIVCVI